jgi:PhnB protein
MQTQIYLDFNGRCEEAVEFYKKTLGAQSMMMMRFADSPQPLQPGCVAPGSESKVMHTAFRIGDTVVLASDCMAGGQPNFHGFRLTLSVATVAEADRVFGALADGGRVDQALSQTFFSPRFGMLQDRFGMGWTIMVPQSQH